mgnify:CR=1 FL=1
MSVCTDGGDYRIGISAWEVTATDHTVDLLQESTSSVPSRQRADGVDAVHPVQTAWGAYTEPINAAAPGNPHSQVAKLNHLIDALASCV